MIRVKIICEGATEETFVRELLHKAFILDHNHPIDLSPIPIGTGKHRGGRINYDRLYVRVRNLLQEDRNAYCTTFFDYYGLPSEFPGKEKARELRSIEDKVAAVCDAMREKLTEEKEIGIERIRRFIPYVQMHEFEALLFSDPAKLAHAIYKPGLVEEFQKIRKAFESPEEINDSETSAPSKRVISLVNGYEKVTNGIQAAQAIGLAAMRRECALFDAWLKRLEALPPLELSPRSRDVP